MSILDILTNYHPDNLIRTVCIVFFGLSLLLTYVLIKLPDFPWTIVSVFGIFNVITAITIFVWTPRYGWRMAWQLWGDCFVVFACSLVALFAFDWWQHRQGKRRQREQEADERACLLGMMTGILARLDSIFACLTGQPVEDIQRN